MVSKMTTLSAAAMHVEHDPKKNFAEYEKYIEEAAKVKARILSLPECSLQGFIWTWDEEKKTFTDDPEQKRYYEATAETVPGPTTAKVAALAKKHNMYIQFGLIETALEDGKKVMFNTAAMVGPDGVLGVHRKVHGAWNPIYGYGDSYNVYDTSLGKLGTVICMDLVFTETARILALKGAQVVVNSSAWSIEESPEKDNRGYRYELMCKANAAFNEVYFISSNEVGKGGRSKANCYGHALIVDPLGRIIADGGYKEGLVYAEIDMEKGWEETYKVAGKFLKRRRPDTYSEIVRPPAQVTYNYAS